jgi:hypothetical protein
MNVGALVNNPMRKKTGASLMRERDALYDWPVCEEGASLRVQRSERQAIPTIEYVDEVRRR